MTLSERVVRIVELQTTTKQRDTVAEHVLVRILSRSITDPDSARDAIATAVADGRLVERDGRYAVGDPSS
ncbi:hypothetical protein [Halomarina oriensis]|uniref:MarR family transcriptional regulator n=1 Tax=Halomarina oriensis TaxID=671145 RepID=A0A6B0GT59_9EURY|nr:hypothetical protein [Halomarina oriensis]MWG36547.1 hypothetical protein [Halomarina oriensis]